MRHSHSSFVHWVPLIGLLVCCTPVTDEGKAWRAPDRLSEGSGARAAVALDAGGAATVLFENLENGGMTAMRHTHADAWTNQQIGFGGFPKLAANADGSVVAVWRLGFGPGDRSTVWSNRYAVGTGWETEVRLDPEEAGDAASPHVAIDPGGNAIAVWHQSDGITETESIWARRSTPAERWGPAELIETDNGGHAGDPRVAMDPDGNAIAVWHQKPDDERPARIWANQYVPGEGWDSPERLDANDLGEARLPEVTIDMEGSATVVWRQSDGERVGIWSNRFTRSGGWGAAKRIDSDDLGDAEHARIGTDADGFAMAVWEQFDGINRGIWANRYAPEDGWGAPERINATGEGGAFRPEVAVSASGAAIAVWLQSDGSRDDVWSSTYTPETGWTTAERVDPSRQGIGPPIQAEVACDADGDAMAVWRVTDGQIFGEAHVWAARYE